MPVGPAGRPAAPTWQERQVPGPFPASRGEAAWWHTLQSGAPDTGEVPATAWQDAQSAVNWAWVTVVWVVPVNGTGWFGEAGPLAWHPTVPWTPLSKEAE